MLTLSEQFWIYRPILPLLVCPLHVQSVLLCSTLCNVRHNDVRFCSCGSTPFKQITCSGLGIGLWCLTPRSTIFQLYRGGQFYWWWKPGENHRPVVCHRQTLSHNVVSSTPRLSKIRTHNVSGDMH